MPHTRDDARRVRSGASAVDAPPPPRRVKVTTGCRLHFGLLLDGTSARRQFGGAGLMLDSPGVELVFERAADWSFAGPEPGCSRVARFVARYREQCAPGHEPPPCRVELRRQIPPHAGLGSGTQLGLAVARALAALGGEPDVPATELARRVGRGARSAVGVHGFEHGGFIVDGGKELSGRGDRHPRSTDGMEVESPHAGASPLFRTAPESEADVIGVLAARVAFPPSWRFVLITPPDEPGLSGRAEKAAFERLPPVSAANTAALRRLLFEELLPAVAEADFGRCGEALYAFNRGVGEPFAAIQGGVFASRRMEVLADRLRARGVRGVGQTSWGPTLFALARDDDDAERLRTDAAAHEGSGDCRLLIAAARNAPAVVGQAFQPDDNRP